MTGFWQWIVPAAWVMVALAMRWMGSRLMRPAIAPAPTLTLDRATTEALTAEDTAWLREQFDLAGGIPDELKQAQPARAVKPIGPLRPMPATFHADDVVVVTIPSTGKDYRGRLGDLLDHHGLKVSDLGVWTVVGRAHCAHDNRVSTRTITEPPRWTCTDCGTTGEEPAEKPKPRRCPHDDAVKRWPNATNWACADCGATGDKPIHRTEETKR